MELADANLDAQCLQLLELLADIEEKKVLLEKHMQNGFLDLAKARYAIGINKVSKLHYPKDMVANFVIECSESIESRFSLLPTHSTFTCNEKSVKEKSSNESLRKRLPNKASEEKNETQDNNKEDINYSNDKNSQSNVFSLNLGKNDPIRWFSVFPPQSLRSAQKSFFQATQVSCEISNLQVRFEELQKSYQSIQTRNVKELESENIH